MIKMTVKWLVTAKKMVKFNESEDAYILADDVTAEGWKTGDSVEVEIKDNVVIKMVKVEKKEEVKKEEKKETPKVKEPVAVRIQPEEPQAVEEQPEEVQIVNWTVAVYSKKNQVIKFEEQSSEKYWYPIKESIHDAFQNVNKGDVITVKIGKVEATSQKGEKYLKDGIVAIKKEEAPVKESIVARNEIPIEEQDNSKPPLIPGQTKQKEQKTELLKESVKQPKYNSTNDSIERQVALKCAIELVKTETEKGVLLVDLQERLNKYTQACLNAMRNAQ